MARPVGPPRTSKQGAAYDCGHRIADIDDTRAVNTVNRGGPMNMYFTRAELAAYGRTAKREWWLWWWRGYWSKQQKDDV